MRSRLSLATALAIFVLSGCAASTTTPRKFTRLSQFIQGGTVDEGDSAVVAILINSNEGLALCSGSLIAPNLVLSAHHCVATPPNNLTCGSGFSATYDASSFVVTTSYDAAAEVFNSNNPVWPTTGDGTWYAVSSVTVPGNDICGDDLSALLLSTPITSVCPLIPSVDTQITDNETYTAVGFGVTSPNGETAGTRYKVSGLTVQCSGDCDDNSDESDTLEWEGGSNGDEGTCEGDSGGPALDSHGRVMGSVSRGPSNSCNSTVYENYYGSEAWIKEMASDAASSGGYSAAGWVTGGSTSNSANGYCSGATDGGTSTGGDSDAGDSSQGGETGHQGDGGIITYIGLGNGTAKGDGCSEPGTDVSPWLAWLMIPAIALRRSRRLR